MKTKQATGYEHFTDEQLSDVITALEMIDFQSQHDRDLLRAVYREYSNRQGGQEP